MFLAPCIKRIVKKNPDCEICLGEDGLGAYIEKDTFRPNRNNYKARLLLKFTGWEYYLNLIKFHYVLHPELVTYTSNLKLRNILPFSSNDSAFNTIIESVWGTYKISKCSILFLQQPLHGEFDELYKLQTSILNTFANSSLANKVTVKLHPREFNLNLPSQLAIIDQTVLYELSVKNTTDLKFIVSVFSSALFTSFLLWGNTTPIVLLYNIGEKAVVISKNMELFVKRFKRVYEKSGGKMYQPKTKEELLQILRNH